MTKSQTSPRFCSSIMYRRILVIVFCLIALTYCTDNNPVSSVTRFDLTPEQLIAAKKEADNGNAEAAKRLAEYYSYVERDGEKAFSWYRRSAELGNTRSQYLLASRHLNDKKDRERALYWFKLAASNGDKDAKEYVDVFFSNPKEIEMVSQEAMSGNGLAAFRLYKHFTLIEWNSERRGFWLSKSAENGYPKGQRVYASFFQNEQRHFWLKKAATGGDITAMQILLKERINQFLGRPQK